jgi:DNA modification methylase
VARKRDVFEGYKNKWPADAIERRKVSELIPYARNARTHSDGQIAQIAASIREWGWTNPVLIDEEGGVIAGHGRLMAARKLGIDEVPCITARGWSEAQKRAYVLADNQLALNAGWDMDLLKVEIGELSDLDFNLDLIGFEANILDRLLAPTGTDGLTDPDETPEPPADPVTRPGDVWTLGKHRLVCGSCTDALVMATALDGNEAHVCLTDPPYGVGFEYNSHKDTEEALDALVADFMPLVLAQTRTVLLTPGQANLWRYPKPEWVLCWYSSAGVGSGPWGFCCWQPILAYGKDPYLKMGKGRRPDSFASNEGKPKDVAHTCPKPVEVWRWLMDRADPSECANFYEPFCGSGTSIITAEMTGRRCFAVELDAAYVDVAVTRWERFTGQAAVLDGDGRTFAELKRERHGATVAPAV